MAERVVSVSLVAEVNNYLSGMARADAATRKTGDGADAAKEAFERQNAAMSKVGASLTAAGAVAVAVTGLAVKAAIDWESAWAGVIKTVDGTPEQLAQVESGLRGLTAVLPSSHEEIAAVAEAAGQLGIQTPNVVAFTKTMLDLGQSTNLSANDAATSIARFTNIMGTSQDQVSNLGSALVGLGNNYATTEAEIMEMSMRLAGAGKQIGLSEGDVLGLATALSSVGIEAEAGGSAMSKVMIDIASSVEQGGDRVEMFARVAGMSAQEFSKQWRTAPADALSAFVKGLANAEAQGGSTLGVLAELGITEVRMRDALLRSAAAADQFSGAMATGNKEFAANTALVEEATKRYATVESKIAIAGNAVRDAAIDFGQVFLPVVGAVADAVTSLAKGFNDMPGWMQGAIAVLGTLAGVVTLGAGAFLLAIPKVAEYSIALATLSSSSIPAVAASATFMTGAVTRATAAMSATARFMTGPWGIALLAASIGVTTLVRALEGMKATAEEVNSAYTATQRTAESMWATTGKGRIELGSMGAGLDRIQAAVDHLNGSDFNVFSYFTASDDIRLTGDRLVDVGKALKEVAATDMDSAITSFQEFAAETDGSKESIWGLIQAMPDFKSALISAATDSGTYVESMSDSEKKTALVNAAMRDTRPAATAAADSYLKIADAAQELTDQVVGLIDAFNEANGIGQDAVTTNARYQDSLAGISSEMERQREDFLKPQKDAYEELNGTLDGFVGDLSGFVATLDESTASGSANAAMLSDVAKNAQTAAKAQYEQDRSTMSAKDAADKYVATLASQRDAFINSATAAGFNRDEVTRLADQIFKMPDQKKIDILMNTSAAQDRLNQLIDRNQYRTITLNVVTNESTVRFPDGNVATSRATGGILPGAPSRKDNMLIAAASGEYVVRADQTSIPANRRALEYINAGGVIRGFENGGEVRPTYASAGPATQVPVIVQQQASGFPSQLTLMVDGREFTAFVKEKAGDVVKGSAAWRDGGAR